MDCISVLVIDDERAVRLAIRSALSAEGMEVSLAENAGEALSLLGEKNFDVILLDLMMPETDGFSLLHTIRERGIYTPVIVLSGLNEDGSMIRGYGLGADDYITKPFSSAVLASKIQALLRRSRVYTQEPEVRSELSCGDFLLKLDIQKAFYQDRELALSSKEFSILCKLMERPGETVPKEQLYREVWNTDTFDQTKLLVYIKRIRDKIEEDSSEPKHLLTEWGRGYRFVP